MHGVLNVCCCVAYMLELDILDRSFTLALLVVFQDTLTLYKGLVIYFKLLNVVLKRVFIFLVVVIINFP